MKNTLFGIIARSVQVIAFIIVVPILLYSIAVESIARIICSIILCPFIYIFTGKFVTFMVDFDEMLLQQLLGYILSWAMDLTEKKK